VDLVLFTISIKIRAHRGEFLNEKADIWADEGRDDVGNVRWHGPSLHPTFSWTEAGVEHRCPMNKTLRARVHLMQDEMQLTITAGSSGETLATQNRLGPVQTAPATKQRLPVRMCQASQTLGSTKTTSAGSANDYTRTWRRGRKASVISKPDVRFSENPESYCITASGASYSQPSEGTPRRHTTTVRGNGISRQRSARPVRQILVHLGLFSGIRRLNEEIVTFHAQQNILTSEEITSSYGRRPDGVDFDAKGKQCVFLKFTLTMDLATSSDEGDWTEKKERKKKERYGMRLYFINYLSAFSGRPWNCSQANFTVGASGSLKRIQFQDRLRLLGVTDSKARDTTRALTVSKTPALPDFMLKRFHDSILRSPEWALSSLPTEQANSQTSAY